MRATCLIHARDMNHSCEWHDWFMCATWLIHVCDVTHSCARRNSFMCVAWLIHVCDLTHSWVWPDSFMCVTWLIHLSCNAASSYVWYDSFIRVIWLIYTSDVTHSSVWHGSFACVPWLIHMCGVTNPCVWRHSFVHRNHRNDPASEFLSTHWWSQHPACQRCFYQPFRNFHPSQQVSTPPVETLTLGRAASGGALAPELPRATRSQPEPIRTIPQKPPFSTFFWVELRQSGWQIPCKWVKQLSNVLPYWHTDKSKWIKHDLCDTRTHTRPIPRTYRRSHPSHVYTLSRPIYHFLAFHCFFSLSATLASQAKVGVSINGAVTRS